jgi:hypothetical protein
MEFALFLEGSVFVVFTFAIEESVVLLMAVVFTLVIENSVVFSLFDAVEEIVFNNPLEVPDNVCKC